MPKIVVGREFLGELWRPAVRSLFVSNLNIFLKKKQAATLTNAFQFSVISFKILLFDDQQKKLFRLTASSDRQKWKKTIWAFGCRPNPSLSLPPPFPWN